MTRVEEEMSKITLQSKKPSLVGFVKTKVALKNANRLTKCVYQG